MKSKYRLDRAAFADDTPVVNRSRYRARNIPAAGALLREEDSEEKQLEIEA